MDEEVNSSPQIDLSGLTNVLERINSNLETIVNSLQGSEENLFIETAKTLYTNSNFDISKKSPLIIATEAISRAAIFMSQLNKSLKK